MVGENELTGWSFCSVGEQIRIEHRFCPRWYHRSVSPPLDFFIECIAHIFFALILAEGDNAVLCQKVSKELIAAVAQGKHTLVGDTQRREWNTARLEDCIELIRVREKLCVEEVSSHLPFLDRTLALCAYGLGVFFW